MNNLIYLSEELLMFLKKNHYKQSTLAKYRRELNVLRRFCESHGSEEYTLELGNAYAADIYINGHFRSRNILIKVVLVLHLPFRLWFVGQPHPSFSLVSDFCSYAQKNRYTNFLHPQHHC